MTRDPDDVTVHAFVDDELDLTRRLEVERSIARDPDLHARVDELRDLSRTVRAEADYHVATDSLRRRVEALAPDGDAASAAVPPPPRPDRRDARRTPAARQDRWGWRVLGAACAATIAVTAGTQLYLARDRRDERLADEVVASHVRSTLGGHAVDIASSDHHQVRPWLSSKLDFSPPVRDTGLGAAVFVGGRIDYLDGRPVAALVYRQGPHVVDEFIWPGDGEHGVTYGGERGYQLAHWTRDGMHHWVVSDVNRAEFGALVERLAAPDDDSPARTR